jgi:hypothetical protein
MIYRKEEYVQHDEEDQQFRIKQVDRLLEVDGEGQRFIGRAVLNMYTNMGVQQIPVSFEIDAQDIQDAFAKYKEVGVPKIDEMKERIQNRLEEARREQQNRIVTPGDSGGKTVRFDELQRSN